MTFTNGFEDWNSKEDAVYDKVRNGVVAAKEMSERAIRLEERERIIKLLEEAKPLQATDELEWGIDEAIALIKGKK